MSKTATDAGGTGPVPLRVLTINLWGDSPPLAKRMAGLIDYLERERPQVVALQEVADFSDRTQADELAGSARYVVHQVDTGRLLWPGEGLAILTHLDAEVAPTVPLPHGLEPWRGGRSPGRPQRRGRLPAAAGHDRCRVR